MVRGASSYLQAGAVPLPPLSHWRAAPELCVLLVLSVGRTMRARVCVRAHESHTVVVPWGAFQVGTGGEGLTDTRVYHTVLCIIQSCVSESPPGTTRVFI